MALLFLQCPFSFLLLVLPLFTVAQTYTSPISLGSSLTALDHDHDEKSNNSYWESPSGEFAFGFQQSANNGASSSSGYLLAIWFNKIPEKTVIWTANGNNTAEKGSKVELTTDGQLLLRDSNGQQLWAATYSVSENRVSYAAMLDNGNFVLANKDSYFLWESFDFPTDTMVPNQALKKGNRLVSCWSETNYSQGRFQAVLRDDGNFVFFLEDFPYWDTKSTLLGNGSEVVFNESGSIYLEGVNGSLGAVIKPDPNGLGEYYQRATLDNDGVFRRYLYPKATNFSTGTQAWFVAASAYQPSNICARFATVVSSNNVPIRASPYCGFNSYCVMDNEEKPQCKCLPSYVYLDSDNEVLLNRDCEPNFRPHVCDELRRYEEAAAQHFNLTEVFNMDWPLFDYFLRKESEEECKEDCLSDCYCVVAVYQQGFCSKKKQPLTNGWSDSALGGIKSFVKVGKDPAGEIQPKDAVLGHKKHSGVSRNGILVLAILAVLNLVIFLAIILAYCFLMRRKKTKKSRSASNLPESCTETRGMNLHKFSYKELQEATDGFKEELGSGASSTVYKGVLAINNQEEVVVAVKRIDKKLREGEDEFRTEVSAIGGTNHKNLVRLLGFCNEGQHQLLVYEFMSNGSLASFLFGSSKPNWDKRVQIALGTARALLYLHEECNTQIIHCDIKPQNILLDDNISARISDFGLAKLLKLDQTRTTTGIRGTKGYVAPEWFNKGAITSKVDVYSFGIVLLEILCCRKNVKLDIEDESKVILSDWAYDRYKERRLDLIVENDGEARKDLKRVEKFLKIALWCIQEDPCVRPCMKKVTQMLEGILQIPLPPDPSSAL